MKVRLGAEGMMMGGKLEGAGLSPPELLWDFAPHPSMPPAQARERC